MSAFMEAIAIVTSWEIQFFDLWFDMWGLIGKMVGAMILGFFLIFGILFILGHLLSWNDRGRI